MSTVDTVTGQPALPAPASDEALWQSLVQNADRAEGHELQRDKSVLVGVPFVITGVTVRPGITQADDTPTNYMSAEVVIAPASVIAQRVKAGRLEPERATLVTPLESLVLNDGSTGFCRQITGYLEDKGMIALPDLPADGSAGESKYDTYFEEWDILKGGERLANGHIHFVVSLLCERGLRVSEYANPRNPRDMSTTYYIG